MAGIVTVIAVLFVFGAFIVISALLGLIHGALIVTLTITFIILGGSILIAAVAGVVLRIKETKHG